VASILLVDDSVTGLDTWTRIFVGEGFDVLPATSLAAALSEFDRREPEAVVSDVQMPCGPDGLELARAVKSRQPSIPVVLYTAGGDADEQLTALHCADDYVAFPYPYEILVNAVAIALDGLRTSRGSSGAIPGIPKRITAVSEAMRALSRKIGRIAPTDKGVLITGETGTGKELLARAVHAYSGRRSKPFCAINCAGFQPGLVESELFGYVRGAFTGAMRDRQGIVADATGGTLFLDEVAELPLDVQSKLLRFLDSGEFRRVGENCTRRADVRIVAATNRLIEREMSSGRFRRDLYFRLAQFECHIPPLRERPEDIRALAVAWCAVAAGGARISVNDAAVEHLTRYSWPGNTRELYNVLHQAALQSFGGRIGAADIGRVLSFVLDGPAGAVVATPDQRAAEPIDVDGDAGDEMKIGRDRLVAALNAARWRRGEAAARLGISRTTLYRLIKILGLE
jgi:DNA-binding NtrC family response regulator